MDMGTTPRAWTRPPLELAEKQLPSKRQLEIKLSKLKILETPTLRLEQYPVSPEAAAELLYMAGFEHDDLEGRIIDLGTGTGRLAIGAVLMSPAHIVGVDVDARALELASENAKTAGVKVKWVQSTIDELDGTYNTVIMNPPNKNHPRGHQIPRQGLPARTDHILNPQGFYQNLPRQICAQV